MRPNHGPSGLVWLGDDGIVWHIDPEHFGGAGLFRHAAVLWLQSASSTTSRLHPHSSGPWRSCRATALAGVRIPAVKITSQPRHWMPMWGPILMPIDTLAALPDSLVQIKPYRGLPNRPNVGTAVAAGSTDELWAQYLRAERHPSIDRPSGTSSGCSGAARASLKARDEIFPLPGRTSQ